jgi:hypothetical protein
MRYGYLLLVIGIAVVGFTALSFHAFKSRDRGKKLRVWDILFVWPLIVDSRRDERGEFKLRKAEVFGICVVIVLMILGFLLTPHRGR